MITFEPSKIKIKRIKVKSLNSMSGALQIIDETVTDREKTYKMDCPKAITGFYKKVHGVTNYTIPQECAIMLYDGNIIALERAPVNSRFTIGLFDESIEWIPQMQSVFDKILSMLKPEYRWFFDGSYIYSFYDGIDLAVAGGKHLSENGNFRAVIAHSIFVNYIGFADDVYIEDRNCLAYIANNGAYSVSTPVWKTLDGIGNNKLKAADSQEYIGLSTQFDKVDNNLMVNLQFAIYAGTILTRQFGYQSIEPLQLPKLMVQLRTVNLPQIPTEVKQTFDIGLTFTQAMAWLLGLNKKVATYDEMMTMKKLFRYLSTNGIFGKKDIHNIVKDEHIDLPLLDLSSLSTAV